MTQQQIAAQTGALGTDGNLNVYVVPGSVIATPYSASVTFDGSSAAGNFIPCLTFKTQTGSIIARCPAPEVVAGDTAEVSWFPHVGDSSGLVTRTPFIGSRVYSTAIETFANATHGDFTYNTVDVDSATMADLGANNRILTATYAGFYQVTAQVTWAANATGRRLIILTQNGYYSNNTGTQVATAAWNAITTAGLRTTAAAFTLTYMAAGDFISVGVEQNSGGNLSSSAGPAGQPYQNYLAAVLLGT